MDLSDGLGSLLPFLIFTVIVVLGNLSDRKKPKVKKKGKPFSKGMKLPDIKPPTVPGKSDIEIVLGQPVPMPVELPEAKSPEHRPHHPDEYEAVHNSYQQYLEQKGHKEDKYQETYFRQEEKTKTKLEAAKEAGSSLSLAQAILAAEVLGKPKALQRRRR